MKHLFIPYNLAVIAKEKGFDKECLQYNPNNHLYSTITKEHPNLYRDYALITYQQIVDWFRGKHKIKISITPRTSGANCIEMWKWNSERVLWEELSGMNSYIDYYEALNKAIEEAFKLI